MNDYQTLASRLVSLKTRIDSSIYNEIQGLIYNNDCEKLEDIPAKACRLITSCDVPKTNICKVSTNFKTTIPPSHPPETMPWYILADLLPCYLEGRTICPEFELWDTFQGVGFPTNHVIRKDKADLGFGELWVQTEYRVWQSCCNECDTEYNYDYLRLQPSVDTWFVCGSDSFAGSDSVSKSFSLAHEKIHVTLKNTSNINVCDKEIHVAPDIDIWSECSDSRSYSYSASTSVSASIYGYKVNSSISNKLAVDWCNHELTFEPTIELDVSCSDVVGDKLSDSASISLCNDTFLKGKVAIQPTLHCDGKIENDIDLTLELGNGGYSFPVGVISGISANGACLDLTTNSLQFNHGILCGITSDSDQICLNLQDVIINLINNNQLVQNALLVFIQNNLYRLNICEYIKQNCDCCTSDSCTCTYSYGTPSGPMHFGATLSSETDNIAPGSVSVKLNSNGLPINMTYNYSYNSNSQEYVFDIYIHGEEHACAECIDSDIANNGITSVIVQYITSNDGVAHTALLQLDNTLYITYSEDCEMCSGGSDSSSSGPAQPCKLYLYEEGGVASIDRVITSPPSSLTNVDISPWYIIQDNGNNTLSISVPNNTAVTLADLGIPCLTQEQINAGIGAVSYILARGYENGQYTEQRLNLLDDTVNIRIEGDCVSCEAQSLEPCECGEGIMQVLVHVVQTADPEVDRPAIDRFDTGYVPSCNFNVGEEVGGGGMELADATLTIVSIDAVQCFESTSDYNDAWAQIPSNNRYWKLW